MICTQCKQPIPFETEDVKVAVVYRDGRTAAHCPHNPFDQADPNIVAILGSKECAQQWAAARVLARRGDEKGVTTT